MHSASLIDDLETQLRTGTNAGRANILKRVTDLFLVNAKHIGDEQVEIFDDVMMRLVDHIEREALIAGRSCPSRAERRHCPGVMPILSVNARRNDDTD